MATPPEKPHESDMPWPSPARLWLLLVLLALASVVSQLDRTVIDPVVGPLKAEFALSDTRFGMTQSLAFGIF